MGLRAFPLRTLGNGRRPLGMGARADQRAAVAARQALQLLLERYGLLQEMAVFLDQEAHALGQGHLDAQALPFVDNSFDVVVLDIMLPDLDGLEVTRRLRAAGVQVPVIPFWFVNARTS